MGRGWNRNRVIKTTPSPSLHSSPAYTPRRARRPRPPAVPLSPPLGAQGRGFRGAGLAPGGGAGRGVPASPPGRASQAPRRRGDLLLCAREARGARSMDRAAVARVGAVASASLCAVLAGVALAQYIFTLKRKTRRKTKIIEMPISKHLWILLTTYAVVLGQTQGQKNAECRKEDWIIKI